jgi:hypothetical protein
LYTTARKSSGLLMAAAEGVAGEVSCDASGGADGANRVNDEVMSERPVKRTLKEGCSRA